MDIKGKILELFRTIDEMDSDKFVTFLTEDAQFRFGNAPAVNSKSAIREAVAGFFSTIKEINHKNKFMGKFQFCIVRRRSNLHQT